MRVFTPFQNQPTRRIKEPKTEHRDVKLFRNPDVNALVAEKAFKDSEILKVFLGDVEFSWADVYKYNVILPAVGPGFFDLLSKPPERFKNDTLFTAFYVVFTPVEITRSLDGINVNFH